MTPVELYRFVMGDQVWTLTPLETDTYYPDAGQPESERYIATVMGRGEIEQKKDLSRAGLEIRLPLAHDLSVNLLTSFSSQVLTLTIWTNRGGVMEVDWKGRLASLKPEDSFLTLNFESFFTSLRRPGLRARFQKSCRHALYGRGCLLDPETFAVAGTTAALSGTLVTVAAAAGYAAGYFTGGMLRDPSGALSYVVSHNGSAIVLQRTPYTLTTAFADTGVATAVTLYPGCDHTRATCHSKFNNRNRYGGFDWIPSKNPMGGNSIT